MQNKGLVLSLADVQALRQAGFTPKGTLVEGGSRGFAEGGDVSGLNPTVTLNVATNRYEVRDKDGRVLYNVEDQNAANRYAANLKSGSLTVPETTMTVEEIEKAKQGDLTGYNARMETLNNATTQTQTGQTTQPTTPDLAATGRERLLGAEGLESFNEAQRRLVEGPGVTTPSPVPTSTTPFVPTSAPFGEVAAPPAPTFESLGAAPAAQAAAQQVAAPEKPDLARAEAVLASDEVKAYIDQVRAAQGEVSANSLVNAAIQDPASLRQLELQAAQIAEAQRVADVGRREVEAGEMISGPAVEQQRVEDLLNKIKAETAQPSELATVQGQLAKLTADFDTENPPAWAAGALRNATAQMAARGLGASSLAGQAILQATFEAATPIAAADAATVAQFEQMNLSNRQQATMLAAQQRAAFLGQEFDQAFQTKVANAAKITEIANMNFNADVQIALENARLAQSVDIANLQARNAKVLSDAAAMSNMELANLNNRQQAAVANARAFLDMDIANLNNQQQTVLFKSQSVVNSMLSDQAAQNAVVNLNTTNENQLNQFFAQIEANAAQFNVAQSNAIAQSNVSELNAMTKFKEEQANALKISYDRNQTAISQARISANASIQSTQISAEASKFASQTSAAAQMASAELRAQADRDIAAAANEARITLMEMEQAFQLESDILAMNYDTMTSNADKAYELVKLDLAGQITLEAAQYEIDAAEDLATKKALADIAIELVSSLG